MLDTIVTKENGLRAAADGDVETLGLFLRQFASPPNDDRAGTKREAPEHGTTAPTVQWNELTTTLFRDAIENGQLVTVRVLLESDIVQHVVHSRHDHQRLLSSLLAHALRDDYVDIVAYLLAHGADPNREIGDDNDDDNDDTNDNGTESPLSLAARLGSLDMAELLLEKGAAVNARRAHDGATALHEAARQNEHEMIALLAQHGADINAQDDLYRETPLHVASKKGHGAAVEKLLQCHADVTCVNRHGSDAAHLARVESHGGVLTMLLAAAGADPKPRASVTTM